MAKLYWRVKRDGKWIFTPCEFPRDTSNDVVIDEMVEYGMVLPHENYVVGEEE
jgi:hypothetical protein